jgi:F-type H+-transporting ATPase subunit b
MIEFSGTIVVQIINFGIFLLIMRALIFKPIISQIEERRNYINASQKKIQEYIAKLEESEKQGKLMLDEARKKSQEIVEEAIKIAEESKNSIINQALDETKKSFEEFKINLQKEVLSTKSALLYEVNNIAEDIANKVTKLSVNQKISA